MSSKPIPVFHGTWGRVLAIDTSHGDGKNTGHGQKIWEWKPGNIKGAGTPDGWTTVLYNSGMLFASISRFTFRLNPADGTTQWGPFTMPGSGGLRTLPCLAIMDDMLFVAYKGRVAALDPKTGNELAIYEGLGEDQMAMIATCEDPSSNIKGNRLVVASSSYVVGLDRELHQLWKTQTGPSTRFQTLATSCAPGDVPGHNGPGGPPYVTGPGS